MKRTEPKLLNDIINEALRNDGLETQFREQRAAYLWQEVVGPGINRYTTRRYVDRGVMHVYISSASLKNELSYHRSRLVQLLNEAVGADVITSFVLH